MFAIDTLIEQIVFPRINPAIAMVHYVNLRHKRWWLLGEIGNRSNRNYENP